MSIGDVLKIIEFIVIALMFYNVSILNLVKHTLNILRVRLYNNSFWYNHFWVSKKNKLLFHKRKHTIYKHMIIIQLFHFPVCLPVFSRAYSCYKFKNDVCNFLFAFTSLPKFFQCFYLVFVIIFLRHHVSTIEIS